jgi:CheY-like chemotaxis protein
VIVITQEKPIPASKLVVGTGIQRERTILCVDEYETLRKTLVPVLKQFGYNALPARDREEALAAARQHQIDVVLLDFRLCPGCPGQGGECLATALQVFNPELKILVWCADGACLRQPPPCAQATFLKPIAPGALAAQLDDVLRNR